MGRYQEYLYLKGNSVLSSLLGSMLKFRDAPTGNPPKMTWKLSFAKFGEKPAGHSKRLWPCTKNGTCVVVESFPETSSNDIFWGKSKWMIPSTKWLVGGFWLTLLPSLLVAWGPQRPNSYGWVGLTSRPCQPFWGILHLVPCYTDEWLCTNLLVSNCVYLQNQHTNIQLHIVSILQPPAPSMVMGLYSTSPPPLWWWCQ